ncbi:hypothetical protein WG906_11245 [Pedobacter sp. P351]|uniref:hypothetical protein n=1 Tax=Pedobacter superstes TaxID=3133441 RepID=UPI00309737E5
MKRKNFLRIAILPIILLTVLAFTNLQPQKDKKDDKGNKQQDQSSNKGKGQEAKENDNHSQGNKNQDNYKGVKRDNAQDNNSGKGNKRQGHDNSDRKDMKNVDSNKNKQFNGNSKKLNGNRDVDIDWNLNDFANRKHPKDQKKVTICHSPSSDKSNGVTINVSENALQAHRNHGDQLGNCTIDYSDRWSDRYIRSRENVYNTYEQTWETMSYSEALLRLAATKLLGIKTNLDRNRTTLTSNEIQRREALILDLQNNVYSLENQLGQTRQKLDSDVNIIIQL